MEIDFSRADADPEGLARSLRAQVCVVGGGIAGLVLAHGLARQGVDVLLLEAGGRTPEPAEQPVLTGVKPVAEPHRGSLEGQSRALGGTSITWGGQLLPLPEDAGWPVGAADLARHTRTAEQMLGVDDLPYSADEFFQQGRFTGPGALGLLPGFRASLSKFAPFGRRNLAASLGQELLRHPRVRVVLHAQVSELELAPGGDRVAAVLVRFPSGQLLRFVAEQFVLAAGTVETCRLLLASRSGAPEGVGNRFGQVGMNFHDHLTVTAATFRGAARERVVREFRPWIVGGVKGTLHSFKLQPGPELGLNPAMAHFTFEEPAGSGAETLRRWLRARQGGREQGLNPALSQLPQAVGDALALYFAANREQRRYVSPRAAVALRLNVAQKTPSTSRIYLAEERDASGKLRAVVDWRLERADLDSLHGFAQHLRARFRQSGLTEAAGTAWVPEVVEPGPGDGVPPGLDDARHAMGGACMESDERTGVVDPDLRVHGVHNLSVASAAAFPDGSPQLPTLTLMALCLRLAERLQKELGPVA